MKNNMVLWIILLVIVGGGAFFGGMKYQENKRSDLRQFGMNMQNSGRLPGEQNGVRIRTGGGQIVGEIITQDDKSITVKLQDGSSKIIVLSEKTSINKATAGSKLDLTTGVKVGVFGMQNTDGSITAQMIQINPISRGPNSDLNKPSPVQ